MQLLSLRLKPRKSIAIKNKLFLSGASDAHSFLCSFSCPLATVAASALLSGSSDAHQHPHSYKTSTHFKAERISRDQFLFFPLEFLELLVLGSAL